MRSRSAVRLKALLWCATIVGSGSVCAQAPEHITVNGVEFVLVDRVEEVASLVRHGELEVRPVVVRGRRHNAPASIVRGGVAGDYIFIFKRRRPRRGKLYCGLFGRACLICGAEIDIDGAVRVYGAPALDQYATNPDALPVTTPGPCFLYYSPTTREVMILTF